VKSSKSMLWLAAKKAQKRIELLTEHRSLQKFSRQAYVTSLYFLREPSLCSLLTVQADIWEPLTSPSRSPNGAKNQLLMHTNTNNLLDLLIL
jgi:hypothetical protein